MYRISEVTGLQDLTPFYLNPASIIAFNSIRK